MDKKDKIEDNKLKPRELTPKINLTEEQRQKAQQIALVELRKMAYLDKQKKESGNSSSD